MAQNGKAVDLLSSVEMFSEAMAERFCGGKNSLLIIASNGDRSLFLSFGEDEDIVDALSTTIYNNDELEDIVQYSHALAICAKAKRPDDNDTE